jgi:intracellular multiplication protein IcmV
MARKGRRLGLFRQMVNVSGWVNLQGIRNTSENIVETFKDIKSARIPPERETFEEAMLRLALDENAIKNRMRQCYYTAWIYFTMGLLLFIYAFYLFFTVHIFGTLVALILSTMTITLAYREAFWYFQMKVRKLGCTFFEFLAFITGRK